MTHGKLERYLGTGVKAVDWTAVDPERRQRLCERVSEITDLRPGLARQRRGIPIARSVERDDGKLISEVLELRQVQDRGARRVVQQDDRRTVTRNSKVDLTVGYLDELATNHFTLLRWAVW